jgi:hypothetical protein
MKWAQSPSRASLFFDVHRSKERLIFVIAVCSVSVTIPSDLSYRLATVRLAVIDEGI